MASLCAQTQSPEVVSGFSFGNSSSNMEVESVTENMEGNIVVVVDSNVCMDSVQVPVIETGAPVLNLESVTKGDYGIDTGAIDVSVIGGYDSLLWSNGAITEDISGMAPGTYTLYVENSLGCESNLVTKIDPSLPTLQNLCLVTVDTATGKNMVVWEKVNKGDILHYNIYRETSTFNVFQFVDSVSNDSLSEYLDAAADPKIRSWRYKISAVDSCGLESSLSAPHKTIHLVKSNFGGDNYLS